MDILPGAAQAGYGADGDRRTGGSLTFMKSQPGLLPHRYLDSSGLWPYYKDMKTMQVTQRIAYLRPVAVKVPPAPRKLIEVSSMDLTQPIPVMS